MNTKRIGNATELKCLAYLYDIGCSVSIPYGNSDKYDMIIDVNGELFKVQCKHPTIGFDDQQNAQTISFDGRWQSHNTQKYQKRQYKKTEIDFFATFYQGKCYLIPVGECNSIKTLRITSPKNHQEKNITYLHDYLAEKILNISSAE